jgi:hypothetical protein
MLMLQVQILLIRLAHELFSTERLNICVGLVTIGFQSTMASIMLADLEEAVEAGNATTMMTNQTANGNMTRGTNLTSP